MTYSGSNNSYFRQLPELDYPSLANDRKSAYDYQVVKNIFKRAVIRNDIFDELVAFTKYSVRGDERPDQVAYNFYGDSGLDWVVLTTNNIIHVRDEWPMGNQDFLTYINGKYTSQEISNIHHYETEILRDSRALVQGVPVPLVRQDSSPILTQVEAILGNLNNEYKPEVNIEDPNNPNPIADRSIGGPSFFSNHYFIEPNRPNETQENV